MKREVVAFKPYVAVVGGSEVAEAGYDSAREVGRLLARAGAAVVCGGLTGVMEAVCSGASSEGGLTIGFLPGEQRSDANEHVAIALPTGMGEMRNMLVVRAADVVIALSGEFGTLSEIAFALRIGKPVVGLDTWDLAKAGAVGDAIALARTPEEAVEKALALVQAR